MKIFLGALIGGLIGWAIWRIQAGPKPTRQTEKSEN
jgi:hypothetical protein